MRPFLVVCIPAALLILLFCPSVVYAQSPPADFALSATTGGAAPWSEKATLTIDSAGNANYARYMSGAALTILAESTFTVSSSGLQQLWKTIQDSSFFTLSPRVADSSVHDGSFGRVVVRANGATHEVIIRNVALPKLEAVIKSINAVIPPSLQLPYALPPKLDLVPRDPCNPPPGSMGMRPLGTSPRMDLLGLKVRALYQPAVATRVAGTTDEDTHAGTVVACDETLSDAVAGGIATTHSKGAFFGDGISLTVDNTHPQTCDPISITMYLEFWGPLATPDNETAIELDIAKKWDGLKTSSGKKVQLGFVTKLDLGATQPPMTPGFHQIELFPKGDFRAHVDGDVGVNNGVGMCQWDIGDDAGTYAHEAGHLMGLPDRYVDYNKQPDGTWVNAETGSVVGNSTAMANLYLTFYPGQSFAAAKQFFDKVDVTSLPTAGHASDLMADNQSPVLQSDIDQITANPGLLVIVTAGNVYASRSDERQNLIGTHTDAVFVKPGERRTLNGIYGACIDEGRGVPVSQAFFDIIPPVESWKGVTSAGAMAKLISYIDSAGLWCGNNESVQEAIWRISDNSVPIYPPSVDTLLQSAGVSIGSQALDFPHLSGSASKDTVSRTFVPNELFVADIRPRFVDGQVGNPSHFTASVSTPLGVISPKTFAWTVLGPDSTAATVAGADSVASVTPSRSGVVSVALKFSVTDQGSGQRKFNSDRRGYLIVPDAYTETFEHTILTDKYPWKSYGDAPWKLSSVNPETGSYSAQPGNTSSFQSSTLGIDVSVPKDTVIIFSMRSAATSFLDQLVFSEDTAKLGLFSDISDWRVVRLPLFAGRHRLTWTASGGGNSLGNNFWIDNIFFPGNVVVTSVADAGQEEIPKVFELDQNYPNPFNPITMIRYGLPRTVYVRLTLYNELGQKVADLVNGTIEAGYHEVRFDGTNLASGAYFCRLEAGSFVDVKKILLVR